MIFELSKTEEILTPSHRKPSARLFRPKIKSLAFSLPATAVHTRI